MTILDDQNFEENIKDGVVVVDFFATWCGPCTAVAPIVEELAEKYNEKVKVFKLDVDNAPETAAKFQVMSIPTVMIFKNGESQKAIIGAQPAVRYSESLDEVLKD